MCLGDKYPELACFCDIRAFHEHACVTHEMFLNLPALYTTTPHDKLRARVRDDMAKCSNYSNGKDEYK